MKKSGQEKKKLINLVIFSVAVIALTCAFVIFIPLYNSITKLNESKLHHILVTKRMLLDQHMSKKIDIVKQITSRTQIRKKLMAFNKGKVTLNQLRDFSVPKLIDALNHSQTALALIRYDRGHKAILKTDKQWPDHLFEQVNPQKKEVQVYRPIKFQGETFFLISAPIMDPKEGFVGTDAVLFDTKAFLADLRKQGSDKTTLRIELVDSINDQFNVLFTTTAIDIPKKYHKRKFLQLLEQHDRNLYNELSQQKIVVRAHQLEIIPWYLLLTQQKSELNALINQQAWLLLFTVLLVILAAAFGIFKISGPLYDRIFEGSKTNSLMSAIASELLKSGPGEKEKVCDSILKSSLELTQSPFGFVGYIDSKTGYLVAPTMTKGVWDECKMPNKDIVFKEFGGMWGWVPNNKKSIFCNDLPSDPRSTGTPEGHVKIHRFASVPVMMDDKLLGVIAVANGPRDYTANDISILEKLATLFALTLEKFDSLEHEAESQEVIARQSKMASMGQMIEFIAHQWKQPLQNITSLTEQMTERALEADNRNNELINQDQQKILDQVIHLGQTMEDFRNFFKPSKQIVRFRACEAAEQMYKLIELGMNKLGVELIVHDHEHFEIEGFPNEFKQAILNIFNNARDNFKEKSISGGKIELFFETRDGKGVVRVRDNGGGAPNNLLPHKIFEPYVTTKGDSGTGIGLQITKSIIENNMKGKVAAINVQDGLEFVIEIPLAKQG